MEIGVIEEIYPIELRKCDEKRKKHSNTHYPS